jgi:hypothetical protein
MTSAIQDAIIILLDEHGGELRGTEELALTLGTTKSWTIRCVRIMQSNGTIKIIPPRCYGRGHRTVYRRNRNQPGLPRRR